MTEHTEAANTTDATTVAASAVTDNVAAVATPEAPPVLSETPAIEAAEPTPPVVEAVAAPRPAEELLKIEVSKFEGHGIDRPMAEQISFAAPQIELPKDDAPHEAQPSSASIRSLDTAKSDLSGARAHLPLAASLGIAAVLGALAGAAATAGFSSDAPKPKVETRTATAGDDTRALKEMLVRLSSELATLKTSVDAASRNSGSQINKLSERIDRAEKAQAEPSAKIAKIADSLDRLEKRQVAASAPATTVAALAPPAHQDVTGSIATEKLQGKPPVVEGWKLHEFFGGRAVVENRTTGTLFEVGPGSNLPGLGRVETIRREDNRIVIVTPKGIISAALDPRRQPQPAPYYPYR
jgi:hypothetical protein